MDKIKAVTESDHETVAELVRLVGAENTLKIIENFSGAAIYIPLMDSVMKNERDTTLYEEFMSGVDYKRLAIKFRLSEATVRDIIKKVRKQRIGTN